MKAMNTSLFLYEQLRLIELKINFGNASKISIMSNNISSLFLGYESKTQVYYSMIFNDLLKQPSLELYNSLLIMERSR